MKIIMTIFFGLLLLASAAAAEGNSNITNIAVTDNMTSRVMTGADFTQVSNINASLVDNSSEPSRYSEKSMNKTFTYDVFLSYSSKDKQIVLDLAERLKKDGLRVWLDRWVIQPGDSIPLELQYGLEQSRTLVMCMSPAYFTLSEWGTLEHYTVLFRDPTNSQRRLIPLLIENCTVPDMLAQFLYIDWRTPSNESYDRLLVACRGGGIAEEPFKG